MALNIRNTETDRLAEELSQATGETKTEAVTVALRDRLARVRREQTNTSLADELDDIGTHCAGLAELDDRSAEQIIGYDDVGLPA